MSLLSAYTPSRLAIWRGYSNFGFPVSQQVATKNFGAVLAAYTLRAFSNNKAYALSTVAQSDVQVSVGGVSFASVALPVNQIWRGIGGDGASVVIAVGGSGGLSTDIARSSDNGVSFFASTVFAPADWNDVAYGPNVGGPNGRFIVCNNAVSATYYTSDDRGVSWTLRVFPSGIVRNVGYFGGLFFGWGASGMYWSADAITWALCAGVAGVSNKWSIAYGVVATIPLWVIVNGATVSWSLDGKTFVPSRFPTTFTPQGVVFDTMQFVFPDSAATNIIYSSPDAKWFTQRMQVDTLACNAVIRDAAGAPLIQVSTGAIRVEDSTAYEVSYV